MIVSISMQWTQILQNLRNESFLKLKYFKSYNSVKDFILI